MNCVRLRVRARVVAPHIFVYAAADFVDATKKIARWNNNVRVLLLCAGRIHYYHRARTLLQYAQYNIGLPIRGNRRRRRRQYGDPSGRGARFYFFLSSPRSISKNFLEQYKR